MLKQMSTKTLTEKIIGRPGVKTITIEPYEEIKITTDSDELIVQGPAVILINQD